MKRSLTGKVVRVRTEMNPARDSLPCAAECERICAVGGFPWRRGVARLLRIGAMGGAVSAH